MLTAPPADLAHARGRTCRYSLNPLRAGQAAEGAVEHEHMRSPLPFLGARTPHLRAHAAPQRPEEGLLALVCPLCAPPPPLPRDHPGVHTGGPGPAPPESLGRTRCVSHRRGPRPPPRAPALRTSCRSPAPTSPGPRPRAEATHQGGHLAELPLWPRPPNGLPLKSQRSASGEDTGATARTRKGAGGGRGGPLHRWGLCLLWAGGRRPTLAVWGRAPEGAAGLSPGRDGPRSSLISLAARRAGAPQGWRGPWGTVPGNRHPLHTLFVTSPDPLRVPRGVGAVVPIHGGGN